MSNQNRPLQLEEIVPDFKATTQLEEIQLYDFIKDSWAVLLSHPAAYTPVCTSELGRLA